MLGDIFGVDVIVFLTIFSLISFCLISLVRLFSSSFISLVETLPFLEEGGVMAESLPLFAAAAFLVLTEEEDDCEDVITVVVVVVDWADF